MDTEMDMLKKVNRIWRRAGFQGNVTMDTLSESIKRMLAVCPAMLAHEYPELYNSLVITVVWK